MQDNTSSTPAGFVDAAVFGFSPDASVEANTAALQNAVDNDKYSRSYYPGARIPRQEQLVFDNIRVCHDQQTDFLSINTPVDVVTIANSSFRNNRIHFHGNKAMPDYFKTVVNLYGCVFNHAGPDELIVNSLPGKEVQFQSSANVELRKGGTGKRNMQEKRTDESNS